MESFAVGTVGLVAFPFSDLSRSKYRPALVLAEVRQDDLILCQITSNPYADPLAVELTDTDFHTGSLQRVSYARPGKLFTAHRSLVRRGVGVLSRAAHGRVIEEVIALLRSEMSEE